MKKKLTQVAKKSGGKVARKKTLMKDVYNYDTEVGVIAKKYGLVMDMPFETKLGDFCKMKGYPAWARILKML